MQLSVMERERRQGKAEPAGWRSHIWAEKDADGQREKHLWEGGFIPLLTNMIEPSLVLSLQSWRRTLATAKQKSFYQHSTCSA